MDTFTSDDPLDREIASKDAEMSKAQASIAEAEAHLKQMKQEVDLLTIELRALKRAASLRPTGSGGGQVQRPMALAPEPPQSSAGRFRDVVDQIRASR